MHDSAVDEDHDQDGYPADQDCDDNDPAVFPGVRRACQSDCDVGTETCLANGTWNTCTARTDCDCSNPGDTRIIDCGNCGQASQECGLDLRWSMSGDCLNEGECAPGEIEHGTCERCGTTSRLCASECAWGTWDESECFGDCAPGEQQTTETGCEPWERNIEECSAQCSWEVAEACSSACLLLARTGTPDFKDEACIPAGIFIMGCDFPTCSASLAASPKHRVALSPFYIDMYEVTVGRYRECVLASVCSEPQVSAYDPNSSYFAANSEDLPINLVTYNQALTFCQWDGGRSLPTDAQWEKAARGPEPREPRNPWGDVHATCEYTPGSDCPNWSSLPSPVNAHPLDVSFYGVYSLGGNLSEMVLDTWYTYSDTGSVELDPVIPSIGLESTFRGRDYYMWVSTIDWTAVRRAQLLGDDIENGTGFRCARPGR